MATESIQDKLDVVMEISYLKKQLEKITRQKNEVLVVSPIPVTARKPRSKASPLMSHYQISVLLGISKRRVCELLADGKLVDCHVYSVKQYLSKSQSPKDSHEGEYHAWKQKRINDFNAIAKAAQNGDHLVK